MIFPLADFSDIATAVGAASGALALLVTAARSARLAPAASKVSEADARMREYERMERQITDLDKRLRNALADLDALREARDSERVKWEIRFEEAERKAEELDGDVRMLEARARRLEEQLLALGVAPVS